jgi:hypothetical protein
MARKFTEKPILSFRRNKNLKNLIGQTKLINNKVVRNSIKQIGKCSPCLTRTINKCCKNIQSTSVFKNRLTNRIFKIFHNVNCKSKFIIYLVECKKCQDKPYVGKTELMANERLNGHRSDAKKPNSILLLNRLLTETYQKKVKDNYYSNVRTFGSKSFKHCHLMVSMKN